MGKNSNCSIDYYYSFRNMAWSKKYNYRKYRSIFYEYGATAAWFFEIYINIYEIKQQNKIILILGGKPYLFDYNKEVRIYNKIGVALNDDDLGTFEKYSQWKEYIQKKYSNLKNNEDFYRFLNKN